ncbi:MAG: hypothetical protein D3909_10210, partial [Candidatus Electrothrix sp. ATG1]|nr:hypothetical protein [Candidatus Electrothrix sp. ATG1]
GLNEKIEGFFDVCAAKGLSGTQGVIMPAVNRRHLMLKKEVGKFIFIKIIQLISMLYLLFVNFKILFRDLLTNLGGKALLLNLLEFLLCKGELLLPLLFTAVPRCFKTRRRRNCIS